MAPKQSSSSTQQAEQTVGQLADQARQKADEATGQVKQQATSQVESRKDQVAQEFGAVAEAIRTAGEQLRQQNHPSTAQYADKAAQRLDLLAHTLRHRDANQLLGEADQMTRKHPELFVGGAFALGLLGARFLKSSKPPEGSDAGSQARTPQPEGFPTETYPGSGALGGVADPLDYAPSQPTTSSPYAPSGEG